MMLDQKIISYISRLTITFPDIKAIWLVGSRSDRNYRIDSDWDLLVFSDEQTFSQMKQNRSFKNPDADLLVVYNGNDFEEPWPETPYPKSGSIQSWKWHQQSETEATYKGNKGLENGTIDIQSKKAIRIRPIESAK